MSKEELLNVLRICNANPKFLEAIELAFELVQDRPWQTITDDEYMDILRQTDGCGQLAFLNMIDQKLKEKNANQEMHSVPQD